MSCGSFVSVRTIAMYLGNLANQTSSRIDIALVFWTLMYRFNTINILYMRTQNLEGANLIGYIIE